jgi:hypothetical protein
LTALLSAVATFETLLELYSHEYMAANPLEGIAYQLTVSRRLDHPGVRSCLMAAYFMDVHGEGTIGMPSATAARVARPLLGAGRAPSSG